MTSTTHTVRRPGARRRVDVKNANYTFIHPGTTAVVPLYVIAAWGIVRGVNDLNTAYLLRKDLKNVSELIIAGLVSTFFDLMIYRTPVKCLVARGQVIEMSEEEGESDNPK